MSVDWPAAGLAAAAVAVLELDATAAGQFMVSRPIVLGPFLGAVLGDLSLGSRLGALCELFSVSERPLGAHLPPNATVAAAAAVLLALGPSQAHAELAFPAGLAAGWLHARVEGALRRGRGGFQVDKRLVRGEDLGLGRLAALEMGKQAVMTFVVLTAALLAGPWLSLLWAGLAQTSAAGLRLGLDLAPWIGLAALLRSFRGTAA